MKYYSLVSINKKLDNNLIEGHWIQDHFGTLESATKLAIFYETSQSTNKKISDVAVLDSIGGYGGPGHSKIGKNLRYLISLSNKL
jgi:hypothetical protein